MLGVWARLSMEVADKKGWSNGVLEWAWQCESELPRGLVSGIRKCSER